MRAREIAAERRKHIKPEVKKLLHFLDNTEATTLFLSRREAGVIANELATLRAEKERVAIMMRRHAKNISEMFGEEE